MRMKPLYFLLSFSSNVVFSSLTKAKSDGFMSKQVNNDKLLIGKNSATELKLAYWFWMELGRPARFHTPKTLLSWSVSMLSLIQQSGLDYERFKWFLIWACRLRDCNGANYGNDFTARNLRTASSIHPSQSCDGVKKGRSEHTHGVRTLPGHGPSRERGEGSRRSR